MVATDNAHPDDRRPPVGALVFWATGGPYGHVAVYVGNGRIVSNDIGDRVPGEGGVYLVDFALDRVSGAPTYLGWAPPIYLDYVKSTRRRCSAPGGNACSA